MSEYVSIVIPIYNGYEYFDECINSVIEQEYTSWELLLGINGHGDDNNPIYLMLKDKVKKLNDERIHIFNFRDIKGAPATINKLVSIAKYNWIAHLDIDDKWHPLKLQAQLTVVNNEGKGCSIIGTGCHYFGDINSTPVLIYGELTMLKFIKNGNMLIHSSVLIKKELANYTDEFVCYDLDCWLRSLILKQRIFNIPYALTFHRIHKQSFFNAGGKQNPDVIFEKYVGNTEQWKLKKFLNDIFRTGI